MVNGLVCIIYDCLILSFTTTCYRMNNTYQGRVAVFLNPYKKDYILGGIELYRDEHNKEGVLILFLRTASLLILNHF